MEMANIPTKVCVSSLNFYFFVFVYFPFYFEKCHHTEIPSGWTNAEIIELLFKYVALIKEYLRNIC